MRYDLESSDSTAGLQDSPGEKCGLFGVYGVENTASVIYRGLFSLQHRGQEGAGIAVSDGGKIRSHKGQGLVSEVFAGAQWNELSGNSGIGHVRYSTTGSTRIQNVQPIVVECVDAIWAVAHNGNLVNARKLRKMYQEAGAIFQTGTDSEILVHLLADPMYRNRPGRIARALRELEGSFAFLIMTGNLVVAARDRMGFKPLSIGRLNGGYVFASETCALAQVGASYLRDVEPGELVTADENGLHSTRFAETPDKLGQCVFEMVYFSRPDSAVFGYNVHLARMQYGMRLAMEHPVEADMVIPVPDSGNCAALGFARGSGINMDFGFIRNHYVGRTFIMPEMSARATYVDMKLSILSDVVRNKRVIVVDDSIVRGTTASRRVKALREAGAKEIHLRISSPPVTHPCFFGIDFPTREELAAGKEDTEAVRKLVGADTLEYLSVDGLLSPFGNPNDFCTACFTGRYPVDVSGASGKLSMETGNQV